MKECSKCKINKEDFYINRNICIECSRKYKQKYRKTDVISEYKTCIICKKNFIGNRGLCTHIKQHKLTPKEYYDKFIKTDNEGLCIKCGNQNNFKKLRSGYHEYCSVLCSNKDNVNKSKITLLEHFGVDSVGKIPAVRVKLSKLMADKIEKDPTSHIIYNPKACNIIDIFGETNGCVFQHALNGGEFRIPGTNYFVDGYDSKSNTVVEYYESHHKYKTEKDKSRANKIIEILNCDFIIIHENGKIEVINKPFKEEE